MSIHGVQQTAPDSGQVRRAVLIYTGLAGTHVGSQSTD